MVYTNEGELIRSLYIYREKIGAGDIQLDKLEVIIKGLQDKKRKKHRRKR